MDVFVCVCMCVCVSVYVSVCLCVQSCTRTRCFERALAFPFDLRGTGNLNAPHFGSRYFQLNAFILVGVSENYSYVRRSFS